MHQCRKTDQNVFLGQTAQSGKIKYIFLWGKLPNLARYKYIFHVVIDACRLCHNLVCFIAC